MNGKISLDKLENLPITYLGRSADMLDIGFGDEKIIQTNNGEKLSNTLNLHVLTGFRLIRENNIIFSSKEMFDPASGDYDSFQWDNQVVQY